MALVGAGEFLPSMDEIDAELLASLGPARPRVAIVPTASYPDGEDVFRRWAAMGVEHFGGLGAEVEAVFIRDRSSADDPTYAQAIGEADLIYFSGGKPRHLLEALAGSAAEAALLAAHARGAAVAGCSAGAMVLAGRQADMRRNVLPWPLRWLSGLGIVPGVAVFPHYDGMPEALAARDGSPGAARDRHRRHRRGDRGGRPGRVMAGTRSRQGDPVARSPPRPLPCRRAGSPGARLNLASRKPVLGSSESGRPAPDRLVNQARAGRVTGPTTVGFPGTDRPLRIQRRRFRRRAARTSRNLNAPGLGPGAFVGRLVGGRRRTDRGDTRQSGRIVRKQSEQ